MKKILFIIATIMLVACNGSSKELRDTLPCDYQTLSREDTMLAMADAFAIQESRCTPNAVSPCGRYVGCLQISKIMVREVNRVLEGQYFEYNDRYDADLSYGMFYAVMRHHNPTLDLDRAVDIWNPRCPREYRENVRHYYDSILCVRTAEL